MTTQWEWPTLDDRTSGPSLIQKLNMKLRALGIALKGKQDDLGWIDVTRFGATGNGVTDDTAAIQRAIDTVATQINTASIYANRGNIVWFPPGRYRVTDTLTLVRGITLMGSGAETTELYCPTTNVDVLYYSRPATTLSILPSITVKGFRITGDAAATYTAGAGIHVDSDDPTPGYGSRVQLDDVTIMYLYEGFRLRNIQGGHIRACQANYCDAANWVFRGFQTLLAVEGCWSSAAGTAGWDISGCSYSSWIGCGSDACGTHGWLVKKQAGDASMFGNVFHIGSEGNATSLFTFDSLSSTRATVFGYPKTSGGTTTDGLVLNNVLGFECVPYIYTSATATGYPLKITGTNTGIVLVAENIGTYNAGANRFSGLDTNAVTIVGYESSGAMVVGGGVSGTVPLAAGQLAVNKRTGVAAAAGQIVSDFRYIASTLGGSGIHRLSADNGTSFGGIEQNALTAGPFTYGTFGDTILYSSDGDVLISAAAACKPTSDAAMDIGSAALRWKDLHLSGNARVRGVAYTWPAANASGVLTNNGSGTLSWAASGGSGSGGMNALQAAGF